MAWCHCPFCTVPLPYAWAPPLWGPPHHAGLAGRPPPAPCGHAWAYHPPGRLTPATDFYGFTGTAPTHVIFHALLTTSGSFSPPITAPGLSNFTAGAVPHLQLRLGPARFSGVTCLSAAFTLDTWCPLVTVIGHGLITAAVIALRVTLHGVFAHISPCLGS